MTVLDANPDPKPPKRIVDRQAFAAFYEGAIENECDCQVCGHYGLSVFPFRRPIGMSVHHIVPRSQGGDDVPANFALLCGHGTADCHGDVEARRNGARERLRAAMTPEQIGYVIQKKGEAWLERHYPA